MAEVGQHVLEVKLLSILQLAKVCVHCFSLAQYKAEQFLFFFSIQKTLMVGLEACTLTFPTALGLHHKYF